jgi:hypothetical protein
VYDATGRYQAGFLWGNNYWMGSMTQCRDIYKSENEDHVSKKQKGYTGLGLIRENSKVVVRPHVNSPFMPRYGVLKVNLTETYTTPKVGTRYIYRSKQRQPHPSVDFSLAPFSLVFVFLDPVIEMTFWFSPKTQEKELKRKLWKLST